MKTQCMGGPHDGREVDVAWPMPQALELVDEDLTEAFLDVPPPPLAPAFRVSRYELARWRTGRGLGQWRYRYAGTR